MPDHARPLREHGPAPGGPVAEPAARLYGEYIWAYVAAIRARAAVAGGPAGVLPLPGAVDSRAAPGRTGRSQPAELRRAPPSCPRSQVDTRRRRPGQEALVTVALSRRGRDDQLRRARAPGSACSASWARAISATTPPWNPCSATSGPTIPTPSWTPCAWARSRCGPVRHRRHPAALVPEARAPGIRRGGQRAQGAGQGHRRLPHRRPGSAGTMW